MLGQLEQCPEALARGELGAHVQWALYTKKKTTVAGVKAKLDTLPRIKGSHIVVCTESERSLACVKDYCYDRDKQSAFQEAEMFMEGTWPTGKPGNQGACEVQELMDALEEHGPMSIRTALRAGVQAGPLSRHLRLWDRASAEYQEERSLTPAEFEVHVLIGEPGTGKSCYVAHNYPKEDVYRWDLSNGGNTCWVTLAALGKSIWVVPEFRCDMPFGLLLRLCDLYPLTLQYKGGEMQCCARTIVLESNWEIPTWYAGMKEKDPAGWELNMAALNRRLKPKAEGGFGVYPNYRTWFHQFKLEERLTQQGGLRVVPPTRRIIPVRTLDEVLEDLGYDENESPWAREHPDFEKETLSDSE